MDGWILLMCQPVFHLNQPTIGPLNLLQYFLRAGILLSRRKLTNKISSSQVLTARHRTHCHSATAPPISIFAESSLTHCREDG
jgi:hypothetical protein